MRRVWLLPSAKSTVTTLSGSSSPKAAHSSSVPFQSSLSTSAVTLLSPDRSVAAMSASTVKEFSPSSTSTPDSVCTADHAS